ncbi:MAG: leucyl aminopeptidase [Actinomycetota bacterium]
MLVSFQIMLKVKPSSAPVWENKADLFAIGAYKDTGLGASAAVIDAKMNGALTGLVARKAFKAEVGETILVPAGGKLKAEAVLLVGLGESGGFGPETVRRAAGAAARASERYNTIAVDLAEGVQGGPRAAAEGVLLGAYRFSRFLSEKPGGTEQAIICGITKAELERSRIVCDATLWARDLVNEPPSNRAPAEFVRLCRERAETRGIKVDVLDEKALAKQGMNGILTVGRGSDSPPRMAVFTYQPKRPKRFIGLIGKGITFDSGGLSLKSADGMETMKMDCSGAAAVVAATTALAELQPRTKIVTAIALAENMPGGRAAKPGDVIRHFGGRTSEVLNTDAEGRLVLADVLAWMSAQKPLAMVDAATLTGGMMVALGTKVAGVLSNREKLAAELIAASGTSGEALWELPLVDDYRQNLKSAVADIKNISDSRWASPIIGGLFLRDFVGDVPWAHLDIAGPAWAYKDEHYCAKGATGYGTRLLVDWVTSLDDN